MTIMTDVWMDGCGAKTFDQHNPATNPECAFREAPAAVDARTIKKGDRLRVVAESGDDFMLTVLDVKRNKVTGAVDLEVQQDGYEPFTFTRKGVR